MKVLISDKLSEKAQSILKDAGVEFDFNPGMSVDELKSCIGEYDGLAIRSATKVTEEILEAASKLKVVGRAGIGVDNVDIPVATQKGVIVMNTPFGNSVTTAEHAISMMLSLARQIPQASESTHAGKWEKSKFMGTEVTGKTLGLIGCGNIGSIVADRAKGLKMKVCVSDPFLSEERASDMGVEKMELADMLRVADFISIHTPLTDSTRGILNKQNLMKAKKGIRIVNCARGGLIVEEDLKELLESGHVAGAALDVFEEEPAKENILFGMENVICTPHLGASTTEAQENVAVQVAEQIADYLKNGTITNALNIPSVSADEAKKLKPYLQLAENLGSFAGQITNTGLKSITIEFFGEVGEYNTKPLASVAIKGLLGALVEGVNMVNSLYIAKERGVQIKEVINESHSDYASLVKITVTTESQTRSIAGTLFAGDPRIVEINDVKLESSFSDNMLYIVNDDKPGFIGAVGSAMGAHKINIANFHLGRSGDSDAIALIEVDEKIGEDVLSEISKLDLVKQVKFLSF